MTINSSVFNINKEPNGVTYLSSKRLDNYQSILHGFSTRIGGVSKHPYDSLNLGLNRGDEREAVIANYQKITEVIGLKLENLVLSDQVHKDHIRIVTKGDAGKGILVESDIEEIDSFITQDKDIGLTTFFADCTPIYMYDPITQTIGMVHSGWRSTALGIGKKTINQMKDTFGVDPGNLQVVLGPGILKCCFEVGQEVIDIFKTLVKSIENYYTRVGTTKYLLDLQGIISEQLVDAGVKLNNIDVADICTKCHSDVFYSHRAHGNQRGSLAAFLALKDTNKSVN